MEVCCVVNSNVVFVLNIIWYLGFMDIMFMVGIDIIFIIIIGNRIDNKKFLECRVLNSNILLKMINNMFNVECK